MDPQNTQEHPPEAHCLEYWLCYIWSGQRNRKDHQTISWHFQVIMLITQKSLQMK